METRSTFFERTARAVRSQLSKHSARNYGYKASEMILIYRDKIYDRGTCWAHVGSQREQGPSVWACTGGSWRTPPWRCAVREQLALARRICVWGGVPAREVARAYAQTST